MNAPWQVTLFGGLRADAPGLAPVDRFRSQKTAALFAFLALYLRREHSREALMEQFWPDSDIEQARASLRTALASLRRQLEPAESGIPAGAILDADRTFVRLNPDAVQVDADRFEAALWAAGRAMREGKPRLPHLLDALRLYRGELLPGFFDDWTITARERLAQARLEALAQARAECEAEQETRAALDLAFQMVEAAPLDEEYGCILVRMLLAAGRLDAARVQFQRMQTAIQEGLGAAPSSAEARRLQATIAGTGPLVLSRTPPPRSSQPIPSPASVSPAPASDAPSDCRLPLQFTRFFGRTEEIAALAAILAPLSENVERLVTLTGVGGAGKTRLAIEVARTLVDAYGGEVYFVPLVDLNRPELIPRAICDSLRVTVPPDGDARAILAASLEARRDCPLLLALDNLEHLLDGPENGAGVVASLLRASVGVRCLVTSRQRLEIDGEREYPVLPLPVPGPIVRAEDGLPEELIRAYPSVQLFADRAKLARPDFAVTPRNAGAVAALCARLEGVPLALELAAARALLLPPEQMLSQLTDRLDFLVSRRRDLPARHRTLRATVAWSYDSLDPEDQQTFRFLSAFRGGWTLDAAREVGEFSSDMAALDALTALRERSLITEMPLTDQIAPQPNGPPRYRMLELLRDFAAEQLTASLSEAAATYRRHANWARGFSIRFSKEVFGPEAALWMARAGAEEDNLRAALVWCQGAARAGDRTAAAIGLEILNFSIRYWNNRAPSREVREWGDELLAHFPVPNDDTADPKDITLRAEGLNVLGIAAQKQHDAAGMLAYLREARDLIRRTSQPMALARVLGNLGNILNYQGEFEQARDAVAEALQIFREQKDRRLESYALNTLGPILFNLGDHDGAVAALEEGLAIKRERGDKPALPYSLVSLGRVYTDTGDYARAVACHREALALSREIGDIPGVQSAITYLCEARAAAPREANPYVTAVAYGAVLAFRQAHGIGRPEEEGRKIVAPLQAALGDQAYQTALAEGALLPLEQAGDML